MGPDPNPTIVSLLTVFEGMAFSLLFTTGVVVVGRLLPSSLYSSGNSVAQMVGFGLGPIIGAGLGGFIYQHAGAVTLYSLASACAVAGAIDRLVRPGGAGARRAGHRCGRPTGGHQHGAVGAAGVSDRDEIAAHRDLVAGLFPTLALDPFAPIGDGWDCFTYLAHDEWVVQIPRTEATEATLRRQIALLPELDERCRRRSRFPSMSRSIPP